MTRNIAALLLLAVSLVPLSAMPARADDASDVKAVISSQLAAFRAGNAQEAFSHAGPELQRLYASPERFMAMVERGYGAVYRSSLVTFEAMETRDGFFRQDVRLSDPRGVGHVATYVLQRQEDGTLKIVAVAIEKSGDIAT